MKAAYKWRLQNGIYGYITDEDAGLPFIYTVSTSNREYSDGTQVAKVTNDGAISLVVSQLSESDYKARFETFKTMINAEFPSVSLLDVSYYYNMENDECVESASSLKCAITDIIFTVSSVTTAQEGEEPNVIITGLNTSTSDGDIQYTMDFILPPGGKGEPGETPNIQATANATTVESSQDASVTVTRTGEDLEPNFKFDFEIPRGLGINQDNTINVYSATSEFISAVTINTTNITSSVLNSSEITVVSANTNALYTNEIKDKVFTREISENGWWTIYNIPLSESGTTTRMGVSLIYELNNTQHVETYYIEANVGNNTPGGISILNGSKTNAAQTYIAKFAIGSTSNSYAVQVYVTGLGMLKINNVEGCGEVSLVKENITSKKELDTSVGLVSEKVTVINGTGNQYLMANGSTSTLSAGTNVTITKNNSGVVTISAASANNRPIQMNNTEILGNNTTPLNLSAGTNVTLTNPSNGVVAISATGVVPVGSIVMWPGTTAPDGWLLCDGTGIPVYGNDIEGYKTLSCTIQGNNIADDELHDFTFIILANNYGQARYKKNSNYGWIADGTWTSAGTIFNVTMWTSDVSDAMLFYSDPAIRMYIGGRLVIVTVDTYQCILLPNLQQRFPIGASQGGTIGKQGSGSTVTGWNTNIGNSGGTDIHKLGLAEMPTHNHTLTFRCAHASEIGGAATWLTTWTVGTEENVKTITGSTGYPSIANAGGNHSHNNIPPFLALNFIIKYK